MNDHTPDTVGVDISKAHLDVHRRASGDSARFTNDAAGFEALASWLGDTAAWVVYESTGPWHRAFEEALAGRLRLACVNAMRARRFAQAMGQEAKTDAADARVLAIQFKVFDVNRPDAWDRMKGFAGGVAGALVGRIRRELPDGGMFAQPMGGAADDLESFLLMKLSGGGDKLLFRGSKPISDPSGTLCVAGTGSTGHYCVRVKTVRVPEGT